MRNNYIFVRHGQTYWNKNGVMHGQYDIPLTYLGQQQANSIAKELATQHFDLCYSSPLSRATNTAKRILRYHRNTPLILDERLKELNKGLLEGQHLSTEKSLRGDHPDVLQRYDVESKIAFYNRVASFINEVEQQYENKDILIVSHSGTTKMLLFYFNKPSLPIHEAYYRIHIRNCVAYKPEKTNKEGSRMKIGLFPMVADILHSGHVLALEKAKKHCDLLVVGLHCKPNYKDPQQSIYERYIQLRSVKWVDEVIPYENCIRDSDMFTSFDYDVYFLGADHKNTLWEMRAEIEEAGKEVIYIDRNHSYSSSKIKNAAQK
jgi:cytidyltransferase-like protein